MYGLNRYLKKVYDVVLFIYFYVFQFQRICGIVDKIDVMQYVIVEEQFLFK